MMLDMVDIVENNFYFHGNPIYPPFSMGINNKTIVSIFHSREYFYITCTKPGNMIFPSPHSWESLKQTPPKRLWRILPHLSKYSIA